MCVWRIISGKFWTWGQFASVFQLPFRTNSVFLHCHIYWEGAKQVHCVNLGNKFPGEMHVIHGETWGKYNLGWPTSLAYSCLFTLQLVWWIKITVFPDYYSIRLNKAFFMTHIYKLVHSVVRKRAWTSIFLSRKEQL